MKLIGTIPIETKRLLLRRLTINDSKEAYKNWYCRKESVKYLLCNEHKNEEQTKILFDYYEKAYTDLATFRWVIELKETNELIGMIEVNENLYTPLDTLEIGYCIGPKFYNNNYATESLQAVIKFLFEVADVKYIYAYCMKENIPSSKVLEKSNMKLENCKKKQVIDKNNNLRELLLYYITKEYYQKNK